MFKLSEYNDRQDFSQVEITPKEAILAKCYECCCWDGSEVLACNIKHCPLWLFRKKWFKIPRRVFDGDKRLKKS